MFLMIIPSTARAPLAPFPSVIFAADSLPDEGVYHVDESEEKAAQMGEVCNASSCAFGRRVELDEAKDDHHIFGGNGEEEVDVDETIGKEPAVSEKDAVDGSRGSDHGDELKGRQGHCADSRADSAEEKVAKKLFRTPIVLQLASEHPEGQEVEEKVGDPSVEKDIGEELPEEIFLPDKDRNKSKVEVDPVAHDHLKEKDGCHDDHQLLDDGCQTVSERETILLVGHLGLQDYLKNKVSVSACKVRIIKNRKSKIANLRCGSLPDSVFFQFVAQDPLADAEALGSLCLNALMFVEGLDNQVPFNLPEGFGQALLTFLKLPLTFGFSLLQMERQILGCDDLSPAEDHSPFDEIFQLPDISRVGVAKEKTSCLLRDVGDLFSILFRIFFQEMVGEERDVLPSLPQRREKD